MGARGGATSTTRRGSAFRVGLRADHLVVFRAFIDHLLKDKLGTTALQTTLHCCPATAGSCCVATPTVDDPRTIVIDEYAIVGNAVTALGSMTKNL